MDISTRRSLDNYITSGRYHRFTEELECKLCGNRWEARFETEYGATSYIRDDNLCPECGADYEEETDDK